MALYYYNFSYRRKKMLHSSSLVYPGTVLIPPSIVAYSDLLFRINTIPFVQK
jgi:hypothetical protein